MLHALDALREIGCEVTVVPVDGDGRVDPAAFSAALRDDTAIASVMYANNEIGTIQPIAEIAALARARGVVFHTDAVQAAGLASDRSRRASASICSRSRRTSSTDPKASACSTCAAGRRLPRRSPAGAKSSGAARGPRTSRDRRDGGGARTCGRRSAKRTPPASRPCATGSRRRILGGPGVRINGSGAPQAAGDRQRDVRRRRSGVAPGAPGSRGRGRLGGERLYLGRAGAEPRDARARRRHPGCDDPLFAGIADDGCRDRPRAAILPPIVEALRRTSPASA